MKSSDPKLWLREVRALWRQWAPGRRSAIWKLLGISVLLTWLNTSPRLNLTLSEDALNDLQLWTPFTSGWVLAPSSSLFALIVLGFIAAYKSGALQGEIRRPRYFAYSVAIFLALTLVSMVTPPGILWSAVAEGVTLIWFGRDLERRWGSRRLMILCALTLAASYGLGALYLYLFGGQRVHGFHPFTRGLILIWGHHIGREQLSFLNIRGDQLRWVVYAFCGFELLLLPPPFGLVTLSATFFLDQYIRGKIPALRSL